MSARSSQASVASTSDSPEQATPTDSSARPTPIGEPSLPDTGPGFRSSAMSEMSQPKPYNWRLSEEQKQEATRRYEAGESCGVLALEYGVSRQSMWDVLRRRTTMRDRIEALPRVEDRSQIQAKRLRALRRYRSRAARIKVAQIRAVKERDRVCVKCGAEGTDVDHIIPVRKGGQTEMDNLQLLCNPCHIEKSRADFKGVS